MANLPESRSSIEPFRDVLKTSGGICFRINQHPCFSFRKARARPRVARQGGTRGCLIRVRVRRILRIPDPVIGGGGSGFLFAEKNSFTQADYVSRLTR